MIIQCWNSVIYSDRIPLKISGWLVTFGYRKSDPSNDTKYIMYTMYTAGCTVKSHYKNRLMQLVYHFIDSKYHKNKSKTLAFVFHLFHIL